MHHQAPGRKKNNKSMTLPKGKLTLYLYYINHRDAGDPRTVVF
jgi:hypothetical protein